MDDHQWEIFSLLKYIFFFWFSLLSRNFIWIFLDIKRISIFCIIDLQESSVGGVCCWQTNLMYFTVNFRWELKRFRSQQLCIDWLMDFFSCFPASSHCNYWIKLWRVFEHCLITFLSKVLHIDSSLLGVTYKIIG